MEVVIIKPRALFNDPFRGGDNKLVLCDTYKPNGEALFNNHRICAKEIFSGQFSSTVSGNDPLIISIFL